MHSHVFAIIDELLIPLVVLFPCRRKKLSGIIIFAPALARELRGHRGYYRIVEKTYETTRQTAQIMSLIISLSHAFAILGYCLFQVRKTKVYKVDFLPH